jgi:polyisoprenoid-binding protein YceI
MQGQALAYDSGMEFLTAPSSRIGLMLTLLCSVPAVTAADRYSIDPVHTRVAFRVMHAGFSPSIGTVSRPTGNLLYDAADPAASQVSVNIHLATLDLGDADWNRKVLEDFLDAGDHPQARFRSTSVEAVSANLLRVTGNLEIAGGTTPVVFSVVLNAHKRHPLTLKKTLGMQASTDFSRKALGIDAWPSLVGDRVHLDVAIEATLSDRNSEDTSP